MKIIVLEEDDNSFLHIFLIHKGILSVLQLSKKLEEKLIYQVACATDKTFIGEQNCLNGKNYEICKNLCIDNTFSNFDIQEKLIKIDRIYLITFIKEITYSLIFRKSLLNNFRNVFKLKPFCESNFIIIHLESKLPQPIDLSWSNKCVCLVLERMHLDSLMSWLSTLGGAFSALGDYDPAFAKKAGVTSYKQMMIASRLRDMDLIARCWLYFALSLIQKRKFKKAEMIIRYVHDWAKPQPEGKVDFRILKMCHGIWTKLKYERGLRTSIKNQIRYSSRHI